MAILVPALVSLRNEFNRLAPNRDKGSDGWIGDSAHSSSSSDHNPDESGNTPYEDADSTDEVHAIDVDRDLRRSDWSMQRAINIIVERHKNGDDDRLQYVIYNGYIWSRTWGWTRRAYTGSNPHDKHAHFSNRYTTAEENDTRPWGLLEEDDDMPTAREVAEEVWTFRPWASPNPISAADAVQQSSKADDALTQVKDLRSEVADLTALVSGLVTKVDELIARP